MKNKACKIVFILSFIPYIFILFNILSGKCIVYGIELHGMERILQNIKRAFRDYVIWTPIVPTIFTLQICYIFRKKTKNIFLCSFIPYLFGLLVAIYYAITGIAFLGETLYYGWDGFFIGLIAVLYSYAEKFPLLPICLIFQIGYVIVTVYKARKKNKPSMGV